MTDPRAKVTVVVPYYNERDNLPYLLAKMSEQTLSPHEVILVNSSSTDASSQFIDEWISVKQPRVRFRNLNAFTSTPGGSKSAGVKASSSDLFAFMDCGLEFPRDWLERQVAALTEQGADWVSGVCLTQGTTLVDKAAIAHTYGYQTARPVIPGSVVRRHVFDRIGLFKDLRAGYDAEWARASERAGLKRVVNKDVVVKYQGVNFASGMSGVFMKSLRYARPSVGRNDTVVPYIYVVASLVGLALVSTILAGNTPPVFLALGLVLYLLARLVIAARKSSDLAYFWRSPLRLLALICVGLVMDIGKTCGFVSGIYLRFIRKRDLVA